MYRTAPLSLRHRGLLQQKLLCGSLRHILLGLWSPVLVLLCCCIALLSPPSLKSPPTVEVSSKEESTAAEGMVLLTPLSLRSPPMMSQQLQKVLSCAVSSVAEVYSIEESTSAESLVLCCLLRRRGLLHGRVYSCRKYCDVLSPPSLRSPPWKSPQLQKVLPCCLPNRRGLHQGRVNSCRKYCAAVSPIIEVSRLGRIFPICMCVSWPGLCARCLQPQGHVSNERILTRYQDFYSPPPPCRISHVLLVYSIQYIYFCIYIVICICFGFLGCTTWIISN